MSSMLPNQELSIAVARERERKIMQDVERRSRSLAIGSARAGAVRVDRHEPRGRLIRFILHHVRHAGPAAAAARPSVASPSRSGR